MNISKVIWTRINNGNPNEAFRISLYNDKEEIVETKFFKDEDVSIKEFYKIEDKYGFMVVNVRYSKIYNWRTKTYTTITKNFVGAKIKQETKDKLLGRV